jgi:hypothetical protein
VPVVPLRDIGQNGIITDVDPFDLPPQAFSFGKNIRIENNRIERGSVFRNVGYLETNPRHLYSYYDRQGDPYLLSINDDGSVWQITADGRQSVTDPSYVPVVTKDAATAVAVNNTIFVNRRDRQPWYRSKEGTANFLPLPDGNGQWPPAWRAQALTSVAGVVVAVNITKDGQKYPNNVLWSDFVPLDGVPNWDIANAVYVGSSAGENTLADMAEPILDGLALKDSVMIYGRNETWNMEYVGGNDMFKFRRVFGKGIINTSGAVEVNGIHYVFGKDDIWAHDGVTQKSVAQSRVRRFIYDTMKVSEEEFFFTAHHPAQSEVLFCYVSDDPYVSFPSGGGFGCNRAAIYNYAADTWYFADLPYVTCATLMISNILREFDQPAFTFDYAGGSYQNQAGEPKFVFVMGSYLNVKYNLDLGLRSFARFNDTATAFPLDTSASQGAFMIREGLDLDELKGELRGYKLCSSIWPEIRMDQTAQPLVFTVGSSDHPNEEPLWGNTQTYDYTMTKLDHNISGRFLFYKIEQTDCLPFSISGFDFDLTLLGKR